MTQKAILGVSDALDQSGEHLAIGWCALVLHDDRHTLAVPVSSGTTSRGQGESALQLTANFPNSAR